MRSAASRGGASSAAHSLSGNLVVLPRSGAHVLDTGHIRPRVSPCPLCLPALTTHQPGIPPFSELVAEFLYRTPRDCVFWITNRRNSEPVKWPKLNSNSGFRDTPPPASARIFIHEASR